MTYNYDPGMYHDIKVCFETINHIFIINCLYLFFIYALLLLGAGYFYKEKLYLMGIACHMLHVLSSCHYRVVFPILS